MRVETNQEVHPAVAMRKACESGGGHRGKRLPSDELHLVLTKSTAAGAVLIGPAGSGRRVAFDAAIARLDPQPRVVHLNGSAHAVALPYGVLSFLLSQLETGHAATRHELVHGLAELLGGEGRKTVITLGSPDLVDHESAAVLAQLASMRKVTLVAVCERPGQLPADLLALLRSGQLARISVPRMGVSQTRKYLEEELGGPVSTLASASLWHLTNSNRDLLHQLVRELVADGKLVLNGECWVIAPGALRIGPVLTTHVTRVLSGLEANHRDLLSLLAVGGPVGLDDLRRLGLADAVGGVRARGLVDVGEEPQGKVQIRVPLLGHLLRERADEDQQEFLEATLAQLHRDPQAARVLTEITAMLELGSFEALVALVDEFAQAGGYSAASWSNDPQQQMAVLKTELYALTVLGLYGQARATLDRAAAALGDAATVWANAEELVETTQILRILKARLSLAEGSPDAIEGLLGSQRSHGKDRQESGMSTVAVSTVWASESLQFMAMAVQAEAWAASSRSREARDLMLRIRSGIDGLRISGVLEQVISSSDCADIECALLRVQLLIGMWRECSESARRLAGGQYAHPAAISFGETVLGILAGLSGGTDAALGSLLPTMHQMSVSPDIGQRNAVEAAVAFCLSDQERNPEAVELLLHNPTLLERTLPLDFFAWAAEVFYSLAVSSVDSTRAAASRMQAMAERAHRDGRVVLEMNSLAMSLRLGMAEAAPRLQALAEELQGPTAASFATMAQAVRDADSSLLADALEQLAHQGQALYAAEPGNELIKILDHKERRRVIATVARFRQLDDPEREAHDMRPVTDDDVPAWTRELTKREVQIARRVIDGMTNAAIARMSGVSVRTVEGHLYQVYSKLHVRNRQELGELDRDSRHTVDAL